MTERSPRLAAAADITIDHSPLHLAVTEDLAGVAACDRRIRAVLARGDDRDRAAERRDRLAEAAEESGRAHDAWLDRNWAGRDRDQAAADRAELVELVEELALRAGADDPRA